MPDKPAAKTSIPDTSSPEANARVGAPSNNAASNGHWVHDDVGPRHYVAPTGRTPSGAPGLEPGPQGKPPTPDTAACSR